jgi:DNA-binding MarR family transcriptional regulator
MRDRTTFLLYRAGQLSHTMANTMLAPIGLSARQVGILTLILEREPLTQTALCDMLGIDRTTMVALIDDLERKRLVVRRRDPSDRRAYVIHPTNRGHAKKVEAIEILDAQKRDFLAPLSARQQQQLLGLLKLLQRPPPHVEKASEG